MWGVVAISPAPPSVFCFLSFGPPCCGVLAPSTPLVGRGEAKGFETFIVTTKRKKVGPYSFLFFTIYILFFFFINEWTTLVLFTGVLLPSSHPKWIRVLVRIWIVLFFFILFILLLGAGWGWGFGESSGRGVDSVALGGGCDVCIPRR